LIVDSAFVSAGIDGRHVGRRGARIWNLGFGHRVIPLNVGLTIVDNPLMPDSKG
jgi:hypothetical protein